MSRLRWFTVFGSLACSVFAQQSTHVPFGTGCHDVARESFGAWFGDGASASLALSGRSMQLLPQGEGYRVTWGGASFLPPGPGAVVLPRSDDGQVAVAPTQPLPTPHGPLALLYVHSNGFVAAAASNDGGAWNVPANDYLPTPQYRNAPATAFWSWHDWNPAEPGSGRIVHEERQLGGERTLCITWDDVENFPTDVQNRGTFQFQFGLTTGRVAYVWVHIDTDTSSTFGSAHLVGYSPGGASLDPGPCTLPLTHAMTTAPDLRALSLRATSSLTVGSIGAGSVAYTVEQAPPMLAGTALRVGLTALSLHDAPGVDLALVGAPGCRAYVRSLDLQLPWLATSPTVVATWALPPGLPDGLLVFAQAVVLVEPAVPGALGIQTSNGLQSRLVTP